VTDANDAGNGDMSVGERIEAWRWRKRMTKAQLADAAGVSRPSISRLIRGVHGMRIGTLELVVEALGLTMEEFYGPVD
jgi:transcriptional regulator with XRE-family HTH domain